MFYLLNKKYSLQVVLLLALLGLSGYRIFTAMELFQAGGQMFVYRALYPVWQAHPLHYRIVAMALLLLETALLQTYYRINSFQEGKSCMPSVFLLAFLNLTGGVEVFSPVMFTVVFCTVLLIMSSGNVRESPFRSSVFFSGVWAGLALLFDPVAVGLVVFAVLALTSNQFAAFKDVLIFLLGFLTALLYVFAYYFMSGGLPQLSCMLSQYPYFGFFRVPGVWSAANVVRAVYCSLLAVYLIIALKLFFDNKLIVLRKRLVSVHFLLMVGIFMMLFSMYGFKMASGYVFLPFALYFSLLCCMRPRRFLHDFLMVALLVLSCL